MKSCDPRTKLLAILLLTSLAIIFRNPLWMFGLALASLLFALVMGTDFAAFLKRFRHFITLLIGVAFVQVIFVRTGTPMLTVGDFTLVYSDGFNRGVATGIRFFVILCAASIMSAENHRRVTQSLLQMKVPYVFAFMMSIAFRFLPLFATAFTEAITALQLRGIDLKEVPLGKKIRVFTYLLLPVIAEAIIKAQDLAIAMEARGFRALPRRTSLMRLRFKTTDIVILIILPFVFAAVLYYYNIYGGI